MKKQTKSKTLAIRPSGPLVTLADMQTMAKAVAKSEMFGVKTEDQALALMLLCQAENIHPVMALRRYHIIEGRPAYRADALQGEFERTGEILWHARDEKMCAATFFRDKHKVNAEAVKRAKIRFAAIQVGKDVSALSELGEVTIIRTFEDAIAKKVAIAWKDGKEILKKNWRQSPRQMLHARCLTEGVRAVNPGLVAGIYTEDEIIDIEPEVYDQRPSAEVIERNVREATAHATDGARTAPESSQAAGVYGPTDVTKENFHERICHFGQPNGQMIGKKVGDLNVNVIKWLYEKWRDKLGPSASADDYALKRAIEFAYAEQKNAGIVGDTGEAKQHIFLHTDVNPQQCGACGKALDDLQHVQVIIAENPNPNKVAIATALIKRAEDLILTPDQFCGLLNRMGILHQGEMLPDLSFEQLNYLQSDKGWSVVKATAEAEGKPKVTDKPRGRRRG